MSKTRLAMAVEREKYSLHWDTKSYFGCAQNILNLPKQLERSERRKNNTDKSVLIVTFSKLATEVSTKDRPNSLFLCRDIFCEIVA